MAKKSKPQHARSQMSSPVSQLRSTPIGEYGFLSDGEVLALLSPGGSIEWMCVPRFDSPSVFGSMLGRQAGSFRVAPTTSRSPRTSVTCPGTMIVETSWGTPTGWLIVRDALLIGPWHHDKDRSKTYRRTPNDYEAEHILLRTIRCASGEVQTIDRLRARLGLRQGARHLGVHRRRATTRAWPAPRARTSSSP